MKKAKTLLSTLLSLAMSVSIVQMPIYAIEEESGDSGWTNPVVETSEPMDDAKVEEPAVEEPEVEAEIAMPAQSLKGSANGVNVEVEAPEGALPAGTTIQVVKAGNDAVEKIAQTVGVPAKNVKAVDISFSYNGEKVQPEVEVEVKMYAKNVDEDAQVAHLHEGKVEIVDTDYDDYDGSVSFEASEFSPFGLIAPMSDDEEAEEPAQTNYSVVINYKFRDGKIAGQEYTASLAAGDDFSATVKNPEVMGYTATLGTYNPELVTVKFTEKELTYSVSAISANVTLDVIYVPAEVKYTVNYYQQNVDDDKYTLFETAEKTGYTESTVKENYDSEKNKYEGFYGLQFERPTIAADGSTVVEVYYDRNYYMMKFDFDGGMDGPEAIYAKYGSAIGDVVEPRKVGYTFKGWSPELPETMPAQNQTLKAQWELVSPKANVTVVIWGENADDENYSYLKSYNVLEDIGSQYTVTEVFFYVCGKEEHKHTSVGSYTKNYRTYYVGGCYPEGNISNKSGGATVGNVICGKEEHTHSSSCQNDSLYKLVKSDTVTVAADGTSVVNVYLDRKEFTVTMKYNTNSTDTITAKWGESISSQWTDVSTKAGNNKWSRSSGGGQPWTSVPQIMPSENRTYYMTSSNGKAQTATYYVENVDNSSQYDVYTTSTTKHGQTLTVTDEDRFPIDGFTYDHGTENGNNWSGAKFYYNRNSYDLIFNNGKENVKTVSVKFEKTLGKVDGVNGFVPSKPDTIPNGYVFEGWYLNPECTGDKVDFNATKMPSANLVVYAHWVPIVHTVNIDPRNGEDTSSIQVPHGTITEESKRPADPIRGVYTFVGWFYEEDGKEKAFDFASMQVTKDLNVYAKWSSNTLVEYTINYQLEDGTEIANPTKGQALAGNSKTFEAKVDTDLYADYQEGYFPKEASHTVVMDIEGNNVFTFVYKPVQSVPYTVKYVDDQGKELRPAKKVEDNKKAVVTEYALTIQGYLPNKFQQRLILTADGVNEIVFIYTEDNTHAMVSVTHITVNAGVETEYKHYEYVGEIGTVYTEEQLQIPNYRFESVTVNEIEKNSNEENSVVVKEKLTSDGLNIVFKYVAQYHVVYSSEPEKVITNDVIKNENVTKVHAGYLYGGLYENATYNLDAAYTNICGADFQPTVGATYYVKEVSDQYLRPTQVEVSNRFTNQLYDVYLTTAIDSDLYDQVGFVISGEYCPVNAVYNKMVIQPGKNSEFTKTEFNASDITVGKVDSGLIASVDYAKINMDDLKTYTGVGTTSGSKTIKCYWVTLDGVRVTGAASRYLTIKESDKDKNDYIEVNADPKEIYFVDMNVLTTAVKN